MTNNEIRRLKRIYEKTSRTNDEIPDLVGTMDGKDDRCQKTYNEISDRVNFNECENYIINQIDGCDSVSSDSYTCSTKSRNIFNIALVNARSLIPKLESLNECQKELQTDVTILTETWTRSNDQINQILQDNEDITNFSMIRKDREVGRGGGVAISFDKRKLLMTRARLPQSKYEVVAAVGRRTGQRRKICVVAAYVPPWYPAARTKKCLQYINDCLLLLCLLYTSPSPRDRQKSRMPSSA